MLLSKALQVFCSFRTFRSSLSEPLNNPTTLGPEFYGTDQHQVMNTSHQHMDRLKGYLKIPSVPYFNLNEASHQCTATECHKDLFTVGHFVIPKLHHTQGKINFSSRSQTFILFVPRLLNLSGAMMAENERSLIYFYCVTKLLILSVKPHQMAGINCLATLYEHPVV